MATAIIRMAMVALIATGTITLTAVTSMVTAITMATAATMATVTPAGPESPSCNGGYHGLVITMDPSTESWGRKRGVQSGRTSKTTITRVNRGPSSQPYDWLRVLLFFG